MTESEYHKLRRSNATHRNFFASRFPTFFRTAQCHSTLQILASARITQTQMSIRY